jgi:hypothetical protein
VAIGQQWDDVGPHVGGHHRAVQKEERLISDHGVKTPTVRPM